jgi:hypothetical protein
MLFSLGRHSFGVWSEGDSACLLAMNIRIMNPPYFLLVLIS